MAKLSGAVYEYLERVYNGVVVTREQVLSVATTRTDIVGNNPDRVELVLVNTGANSAWVFTTPAAFAQGQGIRLAASGGQMSINIIHDSVLPSLNWFGRADVAAVNIFVLEVVREAKV